MTKRIRPDLGPALWAGVVAGLIGGIILSLFFVATGLAEGADIWLGAKLPGAPFLGERAMQPGFDSTAVIVGMLSHFGVSIAWGAIFGVFFAGLSAGATIAAGVVWGFVVWLVMYYTVLPLLGLAQIANSLPIGQAMFQHVLFGASVAVAFFELQPPPLGEALRPDITIRHAERRPTGTN
jgi:uncharacterized membrane protein YagU involved in acid resistance